jgi:hypothetical protein
LAGGKKLAVCPITELGFVRVSVAAFSQAKANQFGGLSGNGGVHFVQCLPHPLP